MKASYRKLLLLLLLLIAVCVTFAACDDPEEENDNRITITYYLSEGGAPVTASIEKGSTLKFYSLPTRAHYEFLGLYDEQGGMIMDRNGNGTVMITEPITLYARWAAETCTFAFDTDGGTPQTSLSGFSLKYGEAISQSLPVVFKDGYSFEGWYCGSRRVTDQNGLFVSGAERLTDNVYSIIGGKIQLTAKFSVKQYTVYFNFGDGTSDFVYVVHGEEIPADRFPEMDDGSKLIAGWTSISGSAVPFEGGVIRDLTLYPIWKNYKEIEFYADKDATEPERTIRVFEGEAQSPYVPEKHGYEFDGWYTSTLFNGNPEPSIHYQLPTTKLYAKWVMKEYELNFVTNNGSVIDTVYYTIESEIQLPTLEKENFTFVGWCQEEDLSDNPITAIPKGTHSITTLYAKFRGDSKGVLLVPGVGSLSSTQVSVEYFASYQLPVPICEGYEFQGWFDGEDDDATAMTDKDGNSLKAWTRLNDTTTLYAKYKQKFFLTVEPNVSGVTVENLKSYYIAGDAVSLNAPQMAGYDLLGWYENDLLICSASVLTLTMGEENRSIELRYAPKTYTVLLDAQGGMCRATSASVKYGEKFDLPVAYKQGYRFLGWQLGATSLTDANGSSNGIWGNTEDGLTLTAAYTEDDTGAIVIFDANGLLAMKDAPDGYYVLVEDIDLFGVEWAPFAFSGTLIGNGFSIKNLSLRSDEGNLGLFSKLTGTVKDVVLENISVISDSYNSVFVGGLCAELLGGSISGVEVSGRVEGDFCRVGGIVGSMNGGSIKNCKNYAAVKSNTYETAISAGGIVSIAHEGEISDCRNYGEISIGYYCGGVIGVCYAYIISGLENHGTVSGKNYVGGVIGLLERAGTYTINDMKNTGSVTGEENVGGVIGRFVNHAGWNYNDTTYTVKLGRFNNEGVIVGTRFVGGIIGYITAYIDGSGSDGSAIMSANSFENKASVSGELYVGGLIGYAYSDNGASQVGSSKSTGAVTAEAYVGGLAGQLENVRLVSSSNEGASVNATYYHLEGSTYYAFVGGYVGYGYYVEDCDNAVPIIYEDRGIYVGGIAGRILNAIKDCSNTAAVTAEDASYVGGLVGELACAGSYDVTQLTNSGAVSGKDYVGGIIGALTNNASWSYNDSTYTLKIIRISNTGAISGESQVGGCFGRLYVDINGSGSDGSTIITANDLTNTGSITATYYAGGLIGYSHSDNGTSQIANSRSSGAVTANAYVGGLAGQLDNVKLYACSNAGATVSATYYLIEGTSYYVYFGGYVGLGYYIENCHNAVEITYEERGMFVGGLAGRLLNAMKNCSNTASVTAEASSYVGGLVGELACAGNYDLIRLTNSGAVTGKDYVGGVFGCVQNYAGWSYNDSVYNLTMSQITNSGAIVGENQVGGCIGRLYGEINGSGSDGYVILTANGLDNTAAITGELYVGGLIGYAYTDSGSSQIAGSKSSGAITAEAYVGGLAGQLSNIKMVECSNAGATVTATYYVLDGTHCYAYVGGYVGLGYYLEKCNNDVPITYEHAASYVGGLAGRLTNTVYYCKNSAQIDAPNASYVGGLVGELACFGSYEIARVENSGAVNGKDCVGGLFGKIYNYSGASYNDTHYTMRMSKFVNTGAVVGNSYVGGCVGYIYVNVTGSSSDGSVTVSANDMKNNANVTASSLVGGLVGEIWTDNGNSLLTDYDCQGEISGNLLIGTQHNFSVRE